MKAVGYIRVSTEEQAREGVSLDNQKERIEKYCAFKGFDLVDLLEDAGVSGGKNKAREGFVSLMAELERRQLDILVTYSLERLSRDMLTLMLFERYLNEYGIELHTVDGQVDTSHPMGWLGFAVAAFMREMERRQVQCAAAQPKWWPFQPAK
jgi:site-specific DNA recombinase